MLKSDAKFLEYDAVVWTIETGCPIHLITTHNSVLSQALAQPFVMNKRRPERYLRSLGGTFVKAV